MNSLKIIVKKTKLILPQPTGTRANFTVRLRYGASRIEHVSNTKTLGALFFSESMSCNQHVNYISKKTI